MSNDTGTLLTPAHKREIRTKIAGNKDFDLLIASLFTDYPHIPHVLIVTFVHEEYLHHGWFEHAQKSLVRLGRDFTEKELETIIENALGGGIIHSLVMALVKRGRPITDAELKIALLRNTDTAIGGLSKIICRHQRRTALVDVVVHLVDKKEYKAAHTLTDFILGKPYNSADATLEKKTKKPSKNQKPNHSYAIAES